MSKQQRIPIAEKLYKDGLTQAMIARQLGVTQQQISQDLYLCCVGFQPVRPHGGRPKGGRAKRLKPHERSEEVMQLWDDGRSQSQIAQAISLTARQVRRIIDRERLWREAVEQAKKDWLVW